MPYNNAIPQPNDQISDSQSDILNNFAGIKTLVDVNHVTFDDPNQGKHFFVEMPQQPAASVTALGEVGLQCLASAYNTNGPELMYLPENGGAQVEVTASRQAAIGWTFWPSGILIKWGQFTVNATGSFTFAFSLLNNPPAFSTLYNVAFTVACNAGNPDPNISVLLNTTTTTAVAMGFNVVARDTAVALSFPATVFYTAIGIV